ncbi:MAG TPA: hypothetical protein VMG58_18085 [Candidatus Sulfotelmatobacter sp.]|nr:hypothetical protein [Candidatus Sulfotelmatobacter sp.]
MSVLSRRRFLEVSAGAPLAVHPFVRSGGAAGFAEAAQRPKALERHGCLLVDAGEHCALPESLAGFRRGLEAASIPFQEVKLGEIPPACFLLVPAAALSAPGLAPALQRSCRLGSTVLLESGLAYLEPVLVASDMELARCAFGLTVGAPVELWPARSGHRRPPYVRYRWPLNAMVRDFSRVIPVFGAGDGLARLADLTVACRRPVGRGTLIFLGSPLGPHLGCGDPEALTLLKALLS